jgi:hypothetical protein
MSHVLRPRIAALSLLAVLLIAVGGASRSRIPAAHANTTAVAVIGCEFIAGAIDGDTTNAITNLDVQTACGGDAPSTHVVGYGTELASGSTLANCTIAAPTCAGTLGIPGMRSIKSLANAIGNGDGVLTKSDFNMADRFDENWDQNQISTDCKFAGNNVIAFASDLACTLDVFVFVDHDQLMNFDLPAGLKSVESQSLAATFGGPVNLDFTCSMDDRSHTGGTNEGGIVGTSVTSSGNAAIGPITSVVTAVGTTPTTISTISTGALMNGDTVVIADATGDFAINGTWVVSNVTGTTFNIPVTNGPVPWTGGGTFTQLNHAQITTATAHGLLVGDVVTMSGSSETGLNGQWRVNSVPSPTSFTVGAGLLNGGADRIAAPGGGGAATAVRDWAVGSDNDCNGGQTAAGIANNGDGVVMFHVLEDTAGRGSVLTVSTDQDAVAQTFDVNVVGPANNVALTLAEPLIETNVTAANVTACQTQTPWTAGIAPPTSTVARAVVTDQDNTVLTRVPVFFNTVPQLSDIANIGIGTPGSITSNTFFTIHPAGAGLPTAAYAVICGGTGTGSATIDAAVNLISCSLTGCIVLGSQDHATQLLTTGGPPSNVALTPVPPSLVCDGTNTSTLTAHVTDGLGHDIADGVPAHFNVTGLGTANPINTVTTGGLASTQIKPLPAASGGVAIVVSAGDAAIAPVAQQSTQVVCTPPPTPTPTPTATPGPGCQGDLDCDGIPDALDNCPSVPNPDQANTNLFNFVRNLPGSDPRGDACDPDISGDGYGNVKKLALGKNLDIYCPIMRADVDGDGVVSILDLAKVAQWFTKSIPPAPQRYAQDADAQISILDLTKMAQVFTQHVSACP